MKKIVGFALFVAISGMVQLVNGSVALQLQVAVQRKESVQQSHDQTKIILRGFLATKRMSETVKFLDPMIAKIEDLCSQVRSRAEFNSTTDLKHALSELDKTMAHVRTARDTLKSHLRWYQNGQWLTTDAQMQYSGHPLNRGCFKTYGEVPYIAQAIYNAEQVIAAEIHAIEELTRKAAIDSCQKMPELLREQEQAIVVLHHARLADAQGEELRERESIAEQEAEAYDVLRERDVESRDAIIATQHAADAVIEKGTTMLVAERSKFLQACGIVQAAQDENMQLRDALERLQAELQASLDREQKQREEKEILEIGKRVEDLKASLQSREDDRDLHKRLQALTGSVSSASSSDQPHKIAI